MVHLSGDGGMAPGSSYPTLNGGSQTLNGFGIASVPMADLGDYDTTDHAHPLLICAEGFPKSAWDPTLRAQLLLAEFGASLWREDDAIKNGPKPDDGPNALMKEIDHLIFSADQRQERLAEIVSQAQDLSLHWADMLMASPASRPATWTLLSASLAIGHMVAMCLKLTFNRARPVQVYPALMPPVVTPPHASFPNSHSLQSHLIAYAVSSAVPELTAAASSLAHRIAENREIAGLHFPSDTAAGKDYALAIFQILQDPTRCPTFATLLGEVKREWGTVTQVTHELHHATPQQRSDRLLERMEQVATAVLSKLAPGNQSSVPPAS